jgi:hypothetical protein
MFTSHFAFLSLFNANAAARRKVHPDKVIQP